MKNKKQFIFLVILCSFILNNGFAQEKFKLFYNEPAEKWVEALPVGNGRLGAMIYGDVNQEHIQFNETTLWEGQPHDYANRGASNYLGEIRQLLFDGKQIEAQKLANEKFMSEPLKQKAYQPFGDLYINFPGHENYTGYTRELDIDKAIAKVSYQVGTTRFEREVFSSHPDQVLVVNLTADRKNALSFDVWLDALHEQKTISSEKNTQTLEVKVKGGALNGTALLKVTTDGKLVSENGKLKITGASKASLILSAATNFVNFNDVSGDALKSASAYLKAAENKSIEKLKAAHITDYQSLYNRFQVSFGDNGKSKLPTDKRIFSFWKDASDPQLIALYVQYGRYLTIASSRSGGKPSTLQGIWNDKLVPPWFSSHTTNINTEMNYWPVEVANLTECHEPLFKFIGECAQTGKNVAREHYACDGWVMHHNVDIWRGTAPVNNANHGIWVSAGGWLSTHLWEHYQFTLDKNFLKENYPLMKDAALFYSQFLIKDPKTGYLISTPSNSPEIGGLVAGPTMDHQIIRNLFKICIKASEILGTDQDFSATLRKMIPEIAPNKIGKHGQLQEWMDDVDDPNEHHRHVSHLWAVYPGYEINPDETPELMKAAQQSLEYRGDNGTGWSLAWKVNYWARFRDGNHSYKLLHELLSPAEIPERDIKGGTYPNLFDAHPPFQIDGNFGGTSGILEMLVQSHLDKIELLPALPDALSEGSISGVCARGGFELAYSWSNGKLKNVEVLSKSGTKCRLKYKDLQIEFNTVKGKKYSFNGNLIKN